MKGVKVQVAKDGVVEVHITGRPGRKYRMLVSGAVVEDIMMVGSTAVFARFLNNWVEYLQVRTNVIEKKVDIGNDNRFLGAS